MNGTQTNFLLVSDLLCGLGGATEGVAQSDYGKVIEGLNHSEHAIAINKANHPKVEFYTKDLYKAEDLSPCDIVIAGIECTNHSNAKGGVSREADSRAMANEMFRYSVMTGCKVMIFENVREFRDWGPLIPKRDKNGKVVKQNRGKNKGKVIMIPDPEKKGRFFHKWKYKLMTEYGFDNYSERMLCAADYGAATTRKRLFMVFAKKGWEIKWPEPTHSKEGSAGLFGLKKWVPCKEFIDLNNHGKSIFGRTNKAGDPSPLSDNTLQRIAFGIKKYALSGKSQFITKYYGNGENHTNVEDPLATVRTKDCHALVTTDQFYIQNYHNTNTGGGLEDPLKTIVTKDEKAFITIEKLQFIDKYFTNKHNVSSIDEPVGSILTVPKMNLTTVDYIQFIHNQNFGRVDDLNNPIATLTTNQRKSMITGELVQFVHKYFSGNHVGSIEEPLPTITTIDHNTLVSVHLGKGFYLLDIKMRWLTPRELALCQGFPEDYILLGSKREQIKGIGNSIPPVFIKALMNSIGEANKHHRA